MTPMERLIARVFDAPGGTISADEAEFARGQATKWARRYFQPRTAEPWLQIKHMSADLASWCVTRNITPEMMTLPYEPDDLWHGTLTDAVTTREITRDELQEYLIDLVRRGTITPPVSSAHHEPATITTPPDPSPAQPTCARPPVPQVVFQPPRPPATH